MKEGLKIITLPTILIILVVFVFPKHFCKVFVTSEAVISTAVMYLSVVGIPHILSPVRYLLYGFIVGTGNTKIVLFSSILGDIAEIFTIIFLKSTNLGNLIILGIGISSWVAVEMTINAIYFFSNKWQKIKV